MKCPYCDATDHDRPEGCPRVSAIEYEFGRVKRIEFVVHPLPMETKIATKRIDLGGAAS